MLSRIGTLEILISAVGIYVTVLFIRFMTLGIKAFSKYLNEKDKSNM